MDDPQRLNNLSQYKLMRVSPWVFMGELGLVIKFFDRWNPMFEFVYHHLFGSCAVTFLVNNNPFQLCHAGMLKIKV